MIKKDAHIVIKRVQLRDIHILMHEVRYPERLLHYIDLCTRYPDQDAGLLFVVPSTYHEDMYGLLEGYHRFCSYIMTGRTTALCAVVYESDEPYVAQISSRF